VKIAKRRRVRLKVRLEVDGGHVLEESVVEYFHGKGTMLPALENEIEGLAPGEKKSGLIAAKNAFGGEDHQPIKEVPRNEFPADAELAIGARFAAKGENGQDLILEVAEVTKTAVKVRLVHPLADKDIRYAVEVIAVTDPTPPPLPIEAIDAEELED
jgi:FKBP-type peptidyl-prolyl cis-trans isomerase 2